MKPNSNPLQDSRFKDLLTHLRSLPTPSPSADFTETVMAHLHQKRFQPRFHLTVGWRLISMIIIILSITICYINTKKEAAPSPSLIKFIVDAQSSDGGWMADGNGEHSRYDTSVTALALLALMREPMVLEGSARGEAVRAGVTHLLRKQNPDGYFDIHSSAAPFSPYLATMALQMAAQLSHAPPSWRTAADQAAPHVPSGAQMANLNRFLAHPDSFPIRWIHAGGPIAMAAIQLLEQSYIPI